MATITAIKDKIRTIDSAGFQILCDDYLSRIGYPNLVSLGTMAGAQRTTRGTPDTYFCKRDDKYIFAEYTVQTDGLVKKIHADIDKCLNEEKTHIPVNQISEIVYCHTSSNITAEDDMALKTKCSNHGILLTLIGIDKLATDIFLMYQTLAKDHLGLSIDTEQIQPVDEFVKQYDSNSLAAPLETTFLFREEEIKKLHDALTKCDVVVVCGAAGVGKTRLAIEYASKCARENDSQVYCIHSRSLGLYDDLCMYFEWPGKYMVVVDDANQINELNLILDLVKKENLFVKIIITVRDYATDKVKNDLLGKASYEQIVIEKLDNEQIESLIKEQFGIQNERFLEKIVSIAEGNARIAMLAGKVAVSTDRLDSIRDASGLYSEYFGPVLHESGIENNKELLATAGVAAFIGAFNLDYIDPILPVLSTVGVDRDHFVMNLTQLSDLEIVDIYHDKAVKFSDQCFANYVLKFVFYEKKTLSLAEMVKACFFVYKDNTLYAVNTLLDVFHSDAIQSFVRSEIKKVWNELKETDSTGFWPFFRAFYPIDLLESLSVLHKVIEDVQPIHILADEMDTDTGKNYRAVHDDIIRILCGYADTTELDTALDLFFQYYLKRPDEYMQFYHAATSAFCITKNSELYGYQTQYKLFSKLIEYSDDWENEFVLILFLETAKEFLRFEFTSHSSARDGKKTTFYQIPLRSSECVMLYRNLILEQMERLSKVGKQPERLRKALEEYGRNVNESSVGVLANDAPFICKVIRAGFSINTLEDCLLVEQIKSCFDRHGIVADELKPFCCNSTMNLYRLLEGPRFLNDFDYNRQKTEHITMIENYLFAEENPCNAFIRLFELFCSIKDKRKRQAASTGINYAFQRNFESPKNCIDIFRYVVSSGEYKDLNFLPPIQKLFAHLPANEIYAVICEFPNSASINCWKYAYFHELPDESIDEQSAEMLLQFLKDDSDRAITESPYRDVLFLKKYERIDDRIIVKACQIILQKSSYSQFMVTIYFGLLFNPYAKCPFNIMDTFRSDLNILEDMYFSLLHDHSNDDCEGSFLLEIARADESFIKRLASELLIEIGHSLRSDVDNRYSALLALDDYNKAVDLLVFETIHNSEDPENSVPKALKQILVVPQNRSDLVERRHEWLLHFISGNAHEVEIMEYLFDALSEFPPDLKRSCIKCFIDNNQDYESFLNLPLLPRFYSAFGSMVPVYKEWIAYLESLLPFFYGIQFVDHKQYIHKQIEWLNKRIIETEIRDIVDK